MRALGLSCAVTVGLVMTGSCVSLAAESPQALFEQRRPHLESFYRDLHQNPELSGQETRTSAKVAAEMRALNLEVIEGIGSTGVVGILRNGPGPTTWVRSELDALPVTEATHLSYASKADG